MKLKLKIIKRVISLFLAVLLFINPLVVPLVYAEGEATDTPTPTPELFVSPAPTNDLPLIEEPTQAPEEPTPTPQSTINSGDANSSTTNDTTVNTNEDTVNGSITTPDGDCSVPGGQSNCPGDIDIGNDNLASVSGTADSSAGTGENNGSNTDGDVDITTGDATASGQMKSDINSNMVIATGSPTLTPTSTPSAGQSSDQSQTSSDSQGSQPETKELTVTNENDGTVSNTGEVTAKTGNNVASENLGNVDLKTGDALAWANLINLLNMNIVGSNFAVLFIDVKDGSQDIDLNEIWKQLEAQSAANSVFLVGDQSSPNLQLIIQNKNDATLENNLSVCALSGNNLANQNNSASIDTGNATALANITNVVNTNILGSKFLFGIINITGQFKGNLILPRPEMFTGVGNSAIGGANIDFSNQNIARVSDSLSSSASTGDDQAVDNGGSSSVDTGNATSYVNDLSLINFNLFMNNWFYLMINNLGNWNGKTLSWSDPTSVEQQSTPSQTYQVEGGQLPSTEDPKAISEEVPESVFENKNTANICNKVKVLASTGNNQANENANDASIKTGNAKAGLNLINLINLNVLASRWFMSLVNVLGNWNGNAIFAYPDLAVSLSDGPSSVGLGESFAYQLSFNNQGYDDAPDVLLKMQFPKGLTYEGDTSGVSANCSVRECSWHVGNLKKSQAGSFEVKVKLDPNFLSIEETSFFGKLVPKVYAAENSESFIVKALITTSLPESNNANNVSDKTTEVRLPATSGVDVSQSNAVDQRLPKLQISAKNNINDFVYPGDTVTFEILVKNTGEVRSENTYLDHSLYDGLPEDFGQAQIKIGTIEPGKTAKVTFGMVIKEGQNYHNGSYHTQSLAAGFAPNGSKVVSDSVRLDFNIHLKNIASLFEVQAIENHEEEKVLGMATENKCPVAQDNILPFILLFILSSLWIVDRSKRLSHKYLMEQND